MKNSHYLISILILIASCSRSSLENDIKTHKLKIRESELCLSDELRRVILQGNSNDSYLNVIVIGYQGEILTS